MNRRNIKRLVIFAVTVLFLIAAASAMWSWYASKPPLEAGQYAVLPGIKKVAGAKKVRVAGPREIVTIDKAAAAAKLDLPGHIAGDDSKQVIATAEVPPYEGKTDVVAVMDTAKGTAGLIARRQPLPLVAFIDRKEIGIRGGLVAGRDGTGCRADVYGRWTFVRVGSVHAGMYGEVSGGQEGKAMLDLSYRW